VDVSASTIVTEIGNGESNNATINASAMMTESARETPRRPVIVAMMTDFGAMFYHIIF